MEQGGVGERRGFQQRTDTAELKKADIFIRILINISQIENFAVLMRVALEQGFQQDLVREIISRPYLVLMRVALEQGFQQIKKV